MRYKEHFGCTALELEYEVRLDRVRNLLTQPAESERLNLNSAHDITVHFGFQSQSHFFQRYQQHFVAKQEIASIRQ